MDSCDGDITGWSASGQLAWMPAHEDRSVIGHGLKSNGERVSFVDWCANRMADIVDNPVLYLDMSQEKRDSIIKETTWLDQRFIIE